MKADSSRRSCLGEGGRIIFYTPPISFPAAQKQILMIYVQDAFQKGFKWHEIFFSTPPNFTPSAQKHFFRFRDILVGLGAMIATSSLTY
jgi:hypothetical protein